MDKLEKLRDNEVGGTKNKNKEQKSESLVQANRTPCVTRTGSLKEGDRRKRGAIDQRHQPTE